MPTEQNTLCDRCHTLVHHNTGSSVIHPSIESITQTIAESPWKHNHIYHIIDAADFPMSLIDQFRRNSPLTPAARSRNRRAKLTHYRQGKLTEVSYIITRSDLLAPRKEQVDRLMPYLFETLRDAMGEWGHKVRLGNVRCVSAKRGWWTRVLKESIWSRGGAGWMVGKVNVGKSNLFEVVFPKGRIQEDFTHMKRSVQLPEENAPSAPSGRDLDLGSPLLPPPQPEALYPTMPIVSALAGTTASPIRVPFGKGKGELIDLPGLQRSSIENCVRLEKRADLIMKTRLWPTRQAVNRSETLFIGGLVRMTPLYHKNITFLFHNFTTLKATPFTEERLGEMLRQTCPPPPSFITDAGVWQNLKSAGRIALRFDVTKQHAGPLTARGGVGLKAGDLPFIVFAVDVLIEGVGWVEIAAQVRRRHFEQGRANEPMNDGAAPGAMYPMVEVYSPQGSFVSSRRPMNAAQLD